MGGLFNPDGRLDIDVVVDKTTRQFITDGGSGWMFRKGVKASDIAQRLACPVGDVLAMGAPKEKSDDDTGRKRKDRKAVGHQTD